MRTLAGQMTLDLGAAALVIAPTCGHAGSPTLPARRCNACCLLALPELQAQADRAITNRPRLDWTGVGGHAQERRLAAMRRVLAGLETRSTRGNGEAWRAGDPASEIASLDRLTATLIRCLAQRADTRWWLKVELIGLEDEDAVFSSVTREGEPGVTDAERVLIAELEGVQAALLQQARHAEPPAPRRADGHR